MGTAARSSSPISTRFTVLVTLAALLGCAPFNPHNAPLQQIDPDKGYRPLSAARSAPTGDVLVFVAFSGGGTRAAAFAYGVLEGLRDAEVVVEGERKRMLDEVDTISGVSGGSFTAAYYGLYGDRIFEEFEPRFLKKNIQGALVRQVVLKFWNWLPLLTPALSRSDLAARYYHKNVFDGATFADLAAADGPRIHINATDLPSGYTVRFNQQAFDTICSDLDPFWISYAVAASSAVPVLLSPITLKNHAGTCGYQPPEWFWGALEQRQTNPRGYAAAAGVLPFMDSNRKKYIHLVDGGISDNLGVRLPLDRIAAIGGIAKTAEVDGAPLPSHLVMIVVNAETEPDPVIDLKSQAPGLAASLNLVSGSQIRRYNFETLMLARSAVAEFARELSTPERKVYGHFIEVSFDVLEDHEERDFFKHLPTSFTLKDEEVDRLKEAGRTILLDSPAFKKLVGALQ